MAFFDIGYLASLSSLTYYSSKSDGYGYHTEYQDEVFYLILPTCNIFKGKKTLDQSLRNMDNVKQWKMFWIVLIFYNFRRFRLYSDFNDIPSSSNTFENCTVWPKT